MARSPHLVRPCFVALGWTLIRNLCPDVLRSFVNWVSCIPKRSCASPKARQYVKKKKNLVFCIWISKKFLHFWLILTSVWDCSSQILVEIHKRDLTFLPLFALKMLEPFKSKKFLGPSPTSEKLTLSFSYSDPACNYFGMFLQDIFQRFRSLCLNLSDNKKKFINLFDFSR